MPTPTGTMRKRLMMPDLSETTFAKRGFHEGDPATRRNLERAGREFLTGFGHAMVSRNMAEVRRSLGTIERNFQGFSYEGASMAFAIADVTTPWRRARVRRFLEGPAVPHIYMAYVGVGWAMARLKRLPRAAWWGVDLPDPLLRWLAVDGYGFHEAYFSTRRHVHERRPVRMRVPWPDTTGYAAHAADQGIGRALWFVCGGDVERLAAVIGGFDPARRADLWSGTGLAATYAGGVDTAELETLRKLGTGFRREIAQGAAFAAQARLRAHLVTPHTRSAVRTFCRASVEDAAAVTQEALVDLPPDGPLPAYEVWRQRIRAAFPEASD
jgi:hypothetical protein